MDFSSDNGGFAYYSYSLIVGKELMLTIQCGNVVAVEIVVQVVFADFVDAVFVSVSASSFMLSVRSHS